jgi:hypothetical protein
LVWKSPAGNPATIMQAVPVVRSRSARRECTPGEREPRGDFPGAVKRAG